MTNTTNATVAAMGGTILNDPPSEKNFAAPEHLDDSNPQRKCSLHTVSIEDPVDGTMRTIPVLRKTNRFKARYGKTRQAQHL